MPTFMHWCRWLRVVLTHFNPLWRVTTFQLPLECFAMCFLLGLGFFVQQSNLKFLLIFSQWTHQILSSHPLKSESVLLLVLLLCHLHLLLLHLFFVLPFVLGFHSAKPFLFPFIVSFVVLLLVLLRNFFSFFLRTFTLRFTPRRTSECAAAWQPLNFNVLFLNSFAFVFLVSIILLFFLASFLTSRLMSGMCEFFYFRCFLFCLSSHSHPVILVSLLLKLFGIVFCFHLRFWLKFLLLVVPCSSWVYHYLHYVSLLAKTLVRACNVEHKYSWQFSLLPLTMIFFGFSVISVYSPLTFLHIYLFLKKKIRFGHKEIENHNCWSVQYGRLAVLKFDLLQVE